MNANQDNQARETDDVVELGIASVDTMGGGFKAGEIMGEPVGTGIADE